MIVLVLLLISPLLTLTLTHVYLLPAQMILLVLLLTFPTLDTHSNSFVSTAWPNDFISLTVNLPHSWLSLLLKVEIFKIFLLETTKPIELWLCRNDHWVVLY